MLFSEFIKNIEKRDIESVHFLTGEESYLHQCVQETLKKNVVAEGAEDFDLEYIGIVF